MVPEKDEKSSLPLIQGKNSKRDKGSYGTSDTHVECGTEGRSCWFNRPRLIEPVMAVYGFAIISIAVLDPQYIQSYLKVIYEEDGSSLTEEDLNIQIQKEVTTWQLYFVLCKFLPPISSLLLVAYTDSVGRKTGLNFIIICDCLQLMCYFIVSTYKLPLAFLLIGQLISAFGGSTMTAFGLTSAYVSDVTSESSKTSRMVFLFLTWLGSVSVGSVVTGLIAGAYGFSTAYATLLLAMVLGLLYCVFYLPESLSYPLMMKNREDQKSLKALLLPAINSFKIVQMNKENPTRTKILRLLLIIAFIDTVGLTGINSTVPTFLVGPPINFRPEKTGLFLGVYGLLSVVGPLFAVKVLKRWLEDASLGILACVSYVVFTAFMAFSPLMPGLLWVAVACSVFGGLSLGVYRSMVCKCGTATEQGAFNAAASSIQALSSVLSGISFFLIYGESLTFYPGLIFIVLCVLFIICAFIYWAIARLQLHSPEHKQEEHAASV